MATNGNGTNSASKKEKMNKTQKCQPSMACAGLSALMGLGLIIGGILVVVHFRDFVDSIIKSKLTLKQEGEATKSWIEPPIRPLLKLYFFDVTNPDGFLERGEKPKLKEVGPYVYEQKWMKVNVSWSENENVVEYAQKKTFYFNRELSVGPESDKFTLPNVPMIASVSQMIYSNNLVKLALGSMLDILKQKPFIEVSVRDIIWGFDHPLIKLGNDILPKEKKLPFNKFGFFVNKNESDGVLLRAFTGIRNIQDIGKVLSYDVDNKKELPFWKGQCNAIKGTDGSVFHPDISRNDTLKIFSKDLCQSLPLVYQKDVEEHGIPGYRFVPPSDVFGTPEENPSNECFCVASNGCTTPSGLFNVTECQFGSPIMISWPHFFQADPKLLEAVEGLSPDQQKHQFHIDVQPKLGNGLRAAIRTQINVAMTPVENVKQTRGFRDMIFPIFWFEDGIEIEDEPTIELLLQAVHTPEIARSAMYPVLFISGSLMVIIVILWYGKKTIFNGGRTKEDMPMDSYKNGHSHYNYTVNQQQQQQQPKMVMKNGVAQTEFV